MEPSPTPFDITDIPQFAYVPGLWEWGLLLFLIIATGILLLCIKRSAKQRTVLIDATQIFMRTLKMYEAEMQRQGTISKSSIDKLSVLLRSYISSQSGVPIQHLSAQELQAQSQKINSVWQRLLAQVITLESLRFMPELQIADATKLFSDIYAALPHSSEVPK